MVARFFLACSSLLLLSLETVAQDTWPFSTFNTGPWTPPRLEVTKTGEVDPGLIFVGPRGNQDAGTAALIYDNNGDLVYQGPDEVTANFRTQKLWGEDVITFWGGDMTDLGFGYGTVHILDNTYKEIYTVQLQDNFLTIDGESRESYIDLHESNITPRNTLLVTAYNVTEYDLTEVGGKPGQYMLDSQWYEVDISTNKILYSWSALDHQAEIPLNESAQSLGDAGTQEIPWDAHHINSVTTTNHGFLISLRHYWSGYYLNYDGSIAWQLAGDDDGADFELDNVAFSWQHDMRVFNETDDGLILNLFNNANNGNEAILATTGMSLNVDLKNRKASTIRNVTDPDDTVYSVSQGSFQWMDTESTHTFMGYGSISKVKEFDVAGNTVLSAQFGDLNEVASYRGYKCPWKATPFWNPVVVANRTSDSTADVYMSWNGATEYDNWAVYSAPSADSTDTTFMSSFDRAGFGTVASLSNLATPYLQVVARQGDNDLGTSDIINF